MSPRGQWVFDPDAGGKKIPESVKRDIEKRINLIADEQFMADITAWKSALEASFAKLTLIPNQRSRSSHLQWFS